MRLEEYFKIKRSKNLCKSEIVAFKVKDLYKGWGDRYKDNQITTEQLETLYHEGNCSLKTKARIKSFLLGKKETKVRVKLGNQFLYVIVNENGRVKIGISEDPIKRANNLSTGSGYMCKCVCYWDVGTKAPALEKKLHEDFNKYRILGEWFSETLPISSIEEKMISYTKFEVSQYMEQSIINN